MPICIILALSVPVHGVLIQAYGIICLRISSGHRSMLSPHKGQARNAKELTVLGATIYRQWMRVVNKYLSFLSPCVALYTVFHGSAACWAPVSYSNNINTQKHTTISFFPFCVSILHPPTSASWDHLPNKLPAMKFSY